MGKIEDGKGQGFQAKVDKNQRLHTLTLVHSLAHHVSRHGQLSFRVFSTVTLASGTVVGLHLKNNHASLGMVVIAIRHQTIDAAGGTALPSVNSYMKVMLGRSRSSGGTEVTTVNQRVGSSVLSDVTVFGSGPTLTGTGTELHRGYTEAEADTDFLIFSQSLILDKGQEMSVEYVTDHTSGTFFVEMAFVMDDLKV